MADSLPTEKLFDLYRLALDEYRFEVKLGWDRTTYFLVLNTGILSVATGLLKRENSRPAQFFISGLFLLGFAISAIGFFSIKRSHEYYRRTIVKKTLIETCLGLTETLPEMHASLNLAVGTTRGQADHKRILEDPEAWINKTQRWTAITFWLQGIFIGIGCVDLIGAILSIIL